MAVVRGIRECNQQCDRLADVYVMDPYPDGWGGAVCLECAEQLKGFVVVDTYGDVTGIIRLLWGEYREAVLQTSKLLDALDTKFDVPDIVVVEAVEAAEADYANTLTCDNSDLRKMFLSGAIEGFIFPAVFGSPHNADRLQEDAYMAGVAVGERMWSELRRTQDA